MTEEREKLLEEVTVLQKEMRATRRNFERQNRTRHKLEVTTTQLEMRIKSVSTRIHDKYQVSIDALPPLASDEQTMDEIDLLDNIEKLKAELSGMGAVKP